MFEATIQIRVRYGETDQMQFVYYGNYALYYEVARTEAMRELGFPYAKMEEIGMMLPVVEMNSKYLGSAHYDDLIMVKTFIKEMPDRFITFHSEIYNKDGKLINIGMVKLIFYNSSEKKVTHIPDEMKLALQKYFNEND